MTIDGQAEAQTPVCVAINLGWRLAELYDSAELPGPARHSRTEPPGHLPGFGEMTGHEKACALAAHIGADVTALAKMLDITLPTTTPITTALDVVGHKKTDVQKVIYETFVQIRDCLAGADPTVALAFGLGRMLADTALLPTEKNPAVLGEQFGKWRLGNAFDWLGDLDAALPPHAARAVATSLRTWQKWVDDRRQTDDSIEVTKVDGITVRALRQQGNMWRRLLTGEQSPNQLLDTKAYVAAAVNLLGNVRAIALRVLWKWLGAVILAVAGVSAALWAAVAYAPAGADRVATVLVSAAGFLGISWTGIRATLGRAIRQAESAMWNTEIVAAIGEKATVLPRHALDRPEAPQQAAQLDDEQDPTIAEENAN